MSSRIEILSGQPDEAERVLISAAVLALSTQDAQSPTSTTEQTSAASLSPWYRAALLESVRGEPYPASQQAHSLWPG